jgi:hypothetical protein
MISKTGAQEAFRRVSGHWQPGDKLVTMPGLARDFVNAGTKVTAAGA